MNEWMNIGYITFAECLSVSCSWSYKDIVNTASRESIQSRRCGHDPVRALSDRWRTSSFTYAHWEWRKA